jgi:hypothetical protein
MMWRKKKWSFIYVTTVEFFMGGRALFVPWEEVCFLLGSSRYLGQY